MELSAFVTGRFFSPLPRWCGPCKILGPRLEKVVAKQHGKVVMAKVDIDDHTDLAIEYEVWIGGLAQGSSVGNAWGHRVAGAGDVSGTTRYPVGGGVVVFLELSGVQITWQR